MKDNYNMEECHYNIQGQLLCSHRNSYKNQIKPFMHEGFVVMGEKCSACAVKSGMFSCRFCNLSSGDDQDFIVYRESNLLNLNDKIGNNHGTLSFGKNFVETCNGCVIDDSTSKMTCYCLNSESNMVPSTIDLSKKIDFNKGFKWV